MGKKEKRDTKKSPVGTLLNYAGNYKYLTFLGLFLSALAMALGMIPYICVWLVSRDLIAVAPNWREATDITKYGMWAFYASFGGIVAYFAALMSTHLAAFRTAANIRKIGMEHLLKAPIGFFDNHASGLLRNKLDGAAGDTETLLAHNLADIVGTITMFVTMVIMMFIFDWRMGGACLIAAVISIGAIFAMMGGRGLAMMREYQEALDRVSKTGTEYVRGIPVVKVFQQTVYSFKVFKQAIEDYSDKAEEYADKACCVPQSVNLTFTEGAFILLVPVAVLLASAAYSSGNFLIFVTNFSFYAIFSAIISTALVRIMFAANGIMLANTALSRMDVIMNAPVMEYAINPKPMKDNSIEFRNVTFAYEGSETNALNNVSFTVGAGEKIALVGPSGGGKTTTASLIPRFWDATNGEVLVGGVNVKDVDAKELMHNIAYVFQNNHLFKTSIMENVRIARPEASDEEVMKALKAAMCMDIIEKLPDGANTIIGSEGIYLSGGETQRVALARAILKDAGIIVLDEATAFADPENEVLIQEALKSLTANKTVVMIAHRLSTIANMDKIYVLHEGCIVEEGSHEELKNGNGLYAKMWSDYNQSTTWRIGGEN